MQISAIAVGWLVLAVLNVGYGILVRAGGSGTGFYRIWILLGICCIVLAFAARFHWWSLLPGWFRGLILAGGTVGILWMLTAVLRIGNAYAQQAEPDLDYIVVLGAQMRESGPSRVLQYRLEAAARYLEENPETICIVSGGQGTNETVTEAEGMEQWLLEHGIAPSRIRKEETSGNTEENIRNSMALIEQTEDGTTVGIVTNNFHLYRALRTARKQGLTNVSGIAAYSTPRYLPNNGLREVLAILRDDLMHFLGR